MPKPDLYVDNHRAAPEPIRRYIGDCDGCFREIYRGCRYLIGPNGELVHDDYECIRELLDKQGFIEG